MYVQGATLNSSKKSDSFNLTHNKEAIYLCISPLDIDVVRITVNYYPILFTCKGKEVEKLTYASFKML